MNESDFPNMGREEILARLKEEIVGPQRTGKPLDISKAIFTKFEDMIGPWMDSITGQEILTVKPKNRYGAGILYPIGLSSQMQAEDDEDSTEQEGLDLDGSDPVEYSENLSDTLEEESSSLDEDISELNVVRKPSSMGISFFASATNTSSIVVELTGGIYSPFSVQNLAKRINQTDTWYLRSEFKKRVELKGDSLGNMKKPKKFVLSQQEPANSSLQIEISCFVRPWEDNKYLITLTAVNRSEDRGHASCLFQSDFNLEIINGEFLPYPSRPLSQASVEDEAYREKARIDDLSSELLFSAYPTFAIGHNCSVNWKSGLISLKKLSADCFPIYEAPSITPDITFQNKEKIKVDMRQLADVSTVRNAAKSLISIIDEYENWIDLQETIFQSSKEKLRFQEAFSSNLADSRSAVAKMRKGIDLLLSDKIALEAFRLANEAMIMQQTRSRLVLRRTTLNAAGRAEVEGEYPTGIPKSSEGFWRAFQIAYFLSVIESVANPSSSERDVVDLIFFPTGGGKTEAYLGVIAFTIALRRLRKSSDTGTAVLMRYTLRLLTTQQFLRAASLICALESIRRQNPNGLGAEEISIGAWLGGSVTPNRRQDAIKALTSMKNDLRKRPWKRENPFLVLQCPWCAATLGPTDSSGSRAKGENSAIPGYEQVLTMPRTVRIKCPDVKCEFARGLPLYVIDEDIYAKRPSLVIGTVDKFALMAWKPESRALFGFTDSGERNVSPPNLIIQDEFHLISGPLGSMVGHYETVLEELCSIMDNDSIVKPKIISSTATIRRFWAQANAVYGRSEVALFPPPLRDISDSFFAVWARKSDGTLEPGRKYVGIFSPGVGSIRSAEVRVGAILASAALELSEDLRDPWWTNLWFFNSLKDLGNAISLFQNDIPKYLKGLTRRDGVAYRRLGKPEELTSRRSNSEIPRVLQQLAATYDSKSKGQAWDTCLASNIIEVGIDIDRLSLMTVVGQPKSTSQYIQVTGRVGRRWQERPGLVITLFSPGRPRDLSHFEHFKTYHERLYAQVEPTSVTPFASPVVLRALRGAMASLIRMRTPINEKPKDVSREFLKYAKQVFNARVAAIEGISIEEQDFLSLELDTIEDEIIKWSRDEWEGENGLLVRQESDRAPKPLTWAIPNSMRNVDATVATDITTLYHEKQTQAELEDNGE